MARECFPKCNDSCLLLVRHLCLMWGVNGSNPLNKKQPLISDSCSRSHVCFLFPFSQSYPEVSQRERSPCSLWLASSPSSIPASGILSCLRQGLGLTRLWDSLGVFLCLLATSFPSLLRDREHPWCLSGVWTPPRSVPRASGSRQRCPAGGCPGGRSRDWGFQQCSHSQYFPADLLQAAAQIPWSLLGALTLHSLDTAQHQLCLLLQEEGTDEWGTAGLGSQRPFLDTKSIPRFLLHSKALFLVLLKLHKCLLFSWKAKCDKSTGFLKAWQFFFLLELF